MVRATCFLLALIALVYTGSQASYVEALASAVDLSNGHPAPRIAMSCGEINKHIDITTGEWVNDEDDSSDCFETKPEILDYCKKMYPEMDITNIVEANDKEEVNEWCKIGNIGKCKHTHKVTPYRCVVGQFESDALMVPSGCKFSHIHGSLCTTHDKWRVQAKESCENLKMEIHKYGMLLPCNVDKFSGVEFVCCPVEPEEKKETEPLPNVEPLSIDGVDPSEDEHDAYFILDEEQEDPKEEHIEFEKARERLEQHHKERMSKVMRQWEEAEENYENLKKSDPVTAEKERKEMMERFQTTVMSLEQEAEALKQQLRDTHLTRIEKAINKKKEQALDMYTKALQASNPKPKDILHGLQKFIRAEYKDRVHSVHHFKHLRQSNPKKATEIKPALLEHLFEIEDRINQSIAMLKKQLPNMYSVLQDKINDMVSDGDQDYIESSLFLKPEPIIAMDNTKPVALEVEQEEPEMEEVEKPAQFDWIDENEKEEMMDPDVKEMLVDTTAAPEETTYDDETKEDESVLPEQHKPMAQQYAANKNSNFKVKQAFADQPSVVKKKMPYMKKSALALGLVGGAVAVATVVIIALVVVRKKSQRVPVNHGFVEVDPKMTMEQRHINMMQQNGYENPTYKYFEMQ
ncbi:amyloid beta precursor like protein 2-like [Glandiceps talaboti]